MKLKTRRTKAELLEELAELRTYIWRMNKENDHLKREIKALTTPQNVINTMAMTVQKTAGLVENIVQSIPAVHRFHKEDIEDTFQRIERNDRQ